MKAADLRAGWRWARLGDCCDIVSGSTPRTDNPLFWHGPIAWATPKDLSALDGSVLEGTPQTITEAGYRSCSTTMLPVGAVLFSSRAPIGLVAIAGRSMCTNQGFKSLVPGPDVHSGFLYWCLRHQAAAVAARGNGTTFKEISKLAMGEIRVPLPSLAEQRRIAGILDKADDVRRKRQFALKFTDAFLRAAFLEMFGDPVTNPSGWPTRPLSEVARMASGVTKGRKLDGKDTVTVPYMRVANVQDGHLALDDVATIDVLPADIERYRLRAGDVLLTEGGDADKLGRGAVWRGAIDPCIHQNHIFRVRPEANVLLPDFLSAQLGSQRGKRYFLRAAKQTTGIASINMTQLSRFPVLLPPMAAQEAYERVVRRYTTWTEKSLEHAATTTLLFESLMQRAFEGRL